MRALGFNPNLSMEKGSTDPVHGLKVAMFGFLDPQAPPNPETRRCMEGQGG